MAEPSPPQARILDAAITLIASQGAQNLSTSEICRNAGVARTTFYRHFPDRGTLYAAIFQYGSMQFEQRLRDTLKAAPAPEFRIGLLARFLANEMLNGQAQKLYRADPHFTDGLTKNVMASAADLFESVMTPVFDMADALSGAHVDRRRAALAFTRYYTSLLIFDGAPLPGDPAEGLEWVIRAFLNGPHS